MMRRPCENADANYGIPAGNGRGSADALKGVPTGQALFLTQPHSSLFIIQSSIFNPHSPSSFSRMLSSARLSFSGKRTLSRAAFSRMERPSLAM